MSLNDLTVYNGEPLVRVGSAADGGYLLHEQDANAYDIFIACGLGGNLDFENDFVRRYNCVCIAYDGDDKTYSRTLEAVSETEKITVIKQNIGATETTTETNLLSIVNNHRNIFLKMDIEGYNFNMGEWPWLNLLTEDNLLRFRQMVIEFHFPNTGQHWDIFKKINKTHYLVHFHANNNNNVVYRIGAKKVPAVFECTYVRKDLIIDPSLNTVPLPRFDDSRNVDDMDYSFNCPPWVHNT